MFEVGDYIVHGSNGVCKVIEIGRQPKHCRRIFIWGTFDTFKHTKREYGRVYSF